VDRYTPAMADPDEPRTDWEIVVERATEATDELLSGLSRLIPQLSSSAAPLDARALGEIVSAPGTVLLVARSLSRRPVSAATSGIVGSLTLVTYRTPTGVRCVIEDVVVEKSARGRGVAIALVERAVELATEAGARHLDLTSRPSRQEANRLYERAGFARRETNVWRLELQAS